MNEMIEQGKSEDRSGKWDLLSNLIAASQEEVKEAPLSDRELCGYVHPKYLLSD